MQLLRNIPHGLNTYIFSDAYLKIGKFKHDDVSLV